MSAIDRMPASALSPCGRGLGEGAGRVCGRKDSSASRTARYPSPQPLPRKRGGALRFAGYAAVFDRVDQGGDVVRRGAFARVPRDVPLLWEHKGAAIGRVEYVREDARGLRVIGRVTDKRAAALVAEGAGLSFGYRVRGMRGPSTRSGTPRELTELELVEVSLVRFPMQRLARVHAVEGDLTALPV